MLDYSDIYTINIIKVKYEDRFSHWEVEALHNGEVILQGTSPAFSGVLDMAIQYGPGEGWMDDDANNS